MTLSAEHLTKRFQNFLAVDHLSFKVEEGEIFGLIGQNGAGKTTTFRMILSLLAPTSGKINWRDHSIRGLERDQIGYLPEERGLYPKMPVEDQLMFFGQLRSWPKKVLKKEISEWLERFDLIEKRKVLTETLSKGNQQKVQLIASLIHKPRLLILDEPFSGLDPVNAGLLKDAVVSLKKEGTVIIFSSHRMDHVEELCDHICLLKKGKSLFSGAILDLKKQYGKINLTIRGPYDKTELAALPGVQSVTKEKEMYRLRLHHEHDARPIFQTLAKNGFIERFSLDYLSLEELFTRKVAGKGE
ncbi:ABC transporter ATP-binding protein [Sporolactobacillus inulinus]|uniref:Sodium ABC transporter ATP-binding protein n=1 Tax=Sporolactobacillus inulinus CASD TaxID=1069536 RepID=A0A0U1QKF3_9BACL|nr:ABC transporter ATP-binding protein [Sporolactobacillus inulinus]KLI01300.1 sodium ABC transporter ATP-binding protein [Sporolactobacillus inulinus CASD]GEB76126.1 ABC transporter ATP-binding protein [Sporolactobacillus inulinus]